VSQGENAGSIYLCPMHSDVRQANPGKCPKCGMDLLPEGTRFAMLRHMSKSPMMIVVMAVIMLAIMYMVFM
jgi:Heavy metal binding domain